MGGPSGEHYDRDTVDGAQTNAQGVTDVGERIMSRSRVDPSVLPMNRRIVSKARGPVGMAYDGSGSVDQLPKIFTDKGPLFSGQVSMNGYLLDPEVSAAVVNDMGDKAPVQVAEFRRIRNLDLSFASLWAEGDGKGNGVESYEQTAYFYAFCCDIPNAETPFCVFVADEGMRESIDRKVLQRLFGDGHESISTVDVFRELDRKFFGNVFLIHRYYRRGDDYALSEWRRCLGNERIISLSGPGREACKDTDKSVTDILLGLLAIMTGARTLEAYLEDMRSARAKPQTEARIEHVRGALEGVAKYAARFPMYRSAEAPEERSDRSRETDVLIHRLRGMLVNESTRPKPAKDGWTYCRGLALPDGVAEETPEWGRIREYLKKAGLDAEIADDREDMIAIVRVQ